MRKVLILIMLSAFFIIPVSAMDFTAPTVPSAGQEYMPADTESFGEGLWYIIKKAIVQLQPNLAEASGICLSLIAAVLLLSLLNCFSDTTKQLTEMVGTFVIAILLLKPSNALIRLGVDTVEELSEYGKLLLPVLTAAMAAQGGTSSSTALYTGTAIFNTVLNSAISKLLIPLIYIFLCLCIANSAIKEDILKSLRGFVKWIMTWCLKIILYVFTGYMGITGVVSGSVDAAALKAAKLTISGMVPVVGSIISDASESILVSAGVMKSAAGVYGLLAIFAVWIGPFLEIGVQYLLLKITASVCSVFGIKRPVELINDFSVAMGYLLAMTSAVCLILLISIVCFMKGVS